MLVWAGRVVVAVGLAVNALLIPHPLGLAAAQVVLAALVLSGRGGVAVLAVAALLLFPASFAELRRLLSHAPLACSCQRTSGHAGWWPVLGAAANAGLIAVAVALARTRTPLRRRAAAKGS